MSNDGWVLNVIKVKGTDNQEELAINKNFFIIVINPYYYSINNWYKIKSDWANKADKASIQKEYLNTWEWAAIYLLCSVGEQERRRADEMMCEKMQEGRHKNRRDWYVEWWDNDMIWNGYNLKNICILIMIENFIGKSRLYITKITEMDWWSYYT